MKKIIENVCFCIIVICLLFILTGCYKDTSNLDENKIIEENTPINEQAFSWIIEPSIDADDIIDIGIDNTSIIFKNNKYNFISQDGKEILDSYYDNYWINSMESPTEVYVFNSDGNNYKLNSDFSLTEDKYFGAEGIDFNIYYNPKNNEFFRMGFEKITINQFNNTELNEYLKNHKTTIAPYIQINEIGNGEFDFEHLKYGYFNIKDLKIILDAKYDYALPYYDDISAVKENGLAGFINIDGDPIFDFCFEEARSIENKKAWVKKDGKWGLIQINIENNELSQINEGNTNDWKSIYKNFLLNDGITDGYVTNANTTIESYIYFSDLDFDNIPELIYFDGSDVGVGGLIPETVYYINSNNSVENAELDEFYGGNIERKKVYSEKDSKNYLMQCYQGQFFSMYDGLKYYSNDLTEYEKLFDNGTDMYVEPTNFSIYDSAEEKDKEIEDAFLKYNN